MTERHLDRLRVRSPALPAAARLRASLSPAVHLLGVLLVAACALLATRTASAACLPLPDPALRELEALASKDARKAIAQAEAMREDLMRSPHVNPQRLASIYAVEAEAYSMIDLDADARSAALKGLSLAPAQQDQLHLRLLSSFAENTFDDEGLRNAYVSIEDARARQKPGTLEDTCMLLVLGEMQHYQGHDDRAIVTLLDAYRQTTAQPMGEARIRVAAGLSMVLKSIGDIEQAITLNQEAIDWYRTNGATVRVLESVYRRGDLLLSKKDYTGALAEFNEVRNFSVTLHDEQGVGFSDLRICEIYTALNKLVEARSSCEHALQVFVGTHSVDMVKEVKYFLAKIDMHDGHVLRALLSLNGVLDHDGKDISQKVLTESYELRAQVNAALENYHEAYVDLDRYLARYHAANDAERTRNVAALRARFGADREAQHNASLRRELALEREQTERQRDTLRWAGATAVAALLLFALMGYVLVLNARHRRKLHEFATLDGLTGLPNRRRTAEVAIEALAAAAAHHTPLTIALIDLDHFKGINDRCGHATGDRVLKDLARLGQGIVLPTDTFGRWGGEEFLLVMPDTSLDIALQRVEALREAALTIALPPTALTMRVSLSAGLASSDEFLTSLDEIIARADVALYEAKAQGRDLVRVADESYRMASSGVRRAIRIR